MHGLSSEGSNQSRQDIVAVMIAIQGLADHLCSLQSALQRHIKLVQLERAVALHDDVRRIVEDILVRPEQQLALRTARRLMRELGTVPFIHRLLWSEHSGDLVLNAVLADIVHPIGTLVAKYPAQICAQARSQLAITQTRLP